MLRYRNARIGTGKSNVVSGSTPFARRVSYSKHIERHVEDYKAETRGEEAETRESRLGIRNLKIRIVEPRLKSRDHSS